MRMISFERLLILLLLACGCAIAPSPRRLESVAVANRIKAATVKLEHERGHGSGFAVAPNLVVTAAHVLRHEPIPVVTTASGQTCHVETAAMFPREDVALVWVSGCELTTVELSPHDPKLGQEVWAAGHAMTFDWTVTHGVVSCESRTSFADGPLVQMDAALIPGMSGGPVMDAHGHVVAMGVGLTTRDGMFGGISWAVPAPTIEKIVSQFWST